MPKSWPPRVAAFVVCLAALCPLPALAAPSITLIDVGQGDAIWIHDDPDIDILVDAGPRKASDVVLAQLAGIPDLDVLLWTHAHEDHIGGVCDVIGAMPVQQVLWNGFDYNSATFNDTLDLISATRIPSATLTAGDTLTWGDYDILVLHPDRQYRNTNDCSIVLRLTYGETGILLTGDAEWDSEQAMLAGSADLACEILKVGHHGSSSSTYSAWLDGVQPETAIVSVGTLNRYGHPSASVLRRLGSRGIDTYRTDRHGTVTIALDGDGYTLESTRAPVCVPLLIVD